MSEKECHYEAVDVRLQGVEKKQDRIDAMFAAIIVGIIINLTVNVMQIRSERNGGAQAEPYRQEQPGEEKQGEGKGLTGAWEILPDISMNTSSGARAAVVCP